MRPRIVQKTLWSPSFGAVVDRFGTPWEITVESCPQSAFAHAARLETRLVWSRKLPGNHGVARGM